MNYPNVLQNLLHGVMPSLADWLAVPVGYEQAEAGASEARQRLLTGRFSPDEQFALRLAEVIFRYWAGHDVEAGMKNFFALLQDRQQQACLLLTMGQLLMARKQNPAWEYLDQGFESAAHLLEAEDYFKVLKRHALLRHLPLYGNPASAAPLEVLLDEAGVISQLKGDGSGGVAESGHQDTVD